MGYALALSTAGFFIAVVVDIVDCLHVMVRCGTSSEKEESELRGRCSMRYYPQGQATHDRFFLGKRQCTTLFLDEARTLIYLDIAFVCIQLLRVSRHRKRPKSAAIDRM